MHPPSILLSYIAFGLGLLISSPTVCLAGPHQKRLIYDLLDRYNVIERPVANESDSIKVSLGLSLMQLLEVDTKNQILVTHMWVAMEWYDMNLKWDPSKFDNIRSIKVPPHRIWKPDVYLYNSFSEGTTYYTLVVVKESGSCTHVTPVVFKSSCKMDITWFPFDYQRCELRFGSWSYDGYELDLRLHDEEGGDLNSLVNHSEWEFLEMSARRNEIFYNCCPEPNIDLTFVLVIRRKPFHFLFNVIVPCVMMTLMALLGFTVPSDSGEKLTLGIANFLSLTFFFIMMSVSGIIPNTSDVIPFINIYLICIMLMVTSSVATTVLILNIHHHSADKMMSQWFRVLFLHWLPCILLMNRQDAYNADVGEGSVHQIESVETKEKQANGNQHESTSHTICTAVEHELLLMLKELRQITKQFNKADAKRDVARDWKFAAKVLDRLCFIIFILFTIFFTIGAFKTGIDLRSLPTK